MKSRKISLLLLALLGLILLIQAFAFESGSTSVTLGKPAVVSGKELQPGEYQLKWVSGNTDCRATLYRRGKPVIEFRGKLVDRNAKAPATAVAAADGPDGKAVIKEIRIGGTTTVLVLE
jgi:hypothetical protein